MKFSTPTKQTTRNPINLVSALYDDRLKSCDVTNERLTRNTKTSKMTDFDNFIVTIGFSVIELVGKCMLDSTQPRNRGLTVVDLLCISHFQMDRSLRVVRISTHREQHLVGDG